MVTFNYDTIPDILAKQDGKLFVPLPEELSASKDKAEQEDKAPVYKVHGSVNWFRDRNQVVSAKDRHGEADLTGNASLRRQTLDEFAIGVPGPQKKNLISGCLSPLWNEAMSCISVADIIIFVGYRFPPSDAMARQGILGAIRKSITDPKVIAILGSGSPDAPRMEALLRAAIKESVGSSEPRILPLFAEDFLSLFWEMDLF